jgi:type IV secretion system protein VirD4
MLPSATGLSGFEANLRVLKTSDGARHYWGGPVAPFQCRGYSGRATLGSPDIKSSGFSVGISVVIVIARETSRLSALADQVASGKSLSACLDPATVIEATAFFLDGCFATRLMIMGNATFASSDPRGGEASACSVAKLIG